ncbi:transposase, partial [Xanthomonas theicola]|uniref:transposase n=2 Tax=Xanthomonas theicola TaxID=56464 RepID=UPI0011AFEE07
MVVVAPLCAESPQRLLESSRHRWQIELAFKRLKWLLPLGHPKKTDPEGAKAWLQGEAFVSTLIESVLAVGERSPPWGRFLPRAEDATTMPPARDRADAPPAAAGHRSGPVATAWPAWLEWDCRRSARTTWTQTVSAARAVRYFQLALMG